MTVFTENHETLSHLHSHWPSQVSPAGLSGPQELVLEEQEDWGRANQDMEIMLMLFLFSFLAAKKLSLLFKLKEGGGLFQLQGYSEDKIHSNLGPQ